MNDQSEFKAALGDLLLLAKASGLKVTEPQIRECFPGWELTTEQWRLIYSYLELNQITVEGHESHPESLSYLRGGDGGEEERGGASGKRSKGGASSEKRLTGEDTKCYRMYLEEIRAIEEISEWELPGLLTAVKLGNRAARNRLAEGHLGRVVELMAMEDFEGGDFGVYITREICSAMDAALAEQTGERDTGSYLAAQANAIMEATEELVKELGREATLSEVAQRMNLSEDMTRDIMKISMDALAVVEAHGSGEKFGRE